MGDDARSRSGAYREWLHAAKDGQQLATIRAHVTQQRVCGDARFQAMVARTLNRCVR